MPLFKRLFSYGLSIVFFIVFFFTFNSASAQVAEGVNYQAVARDNNGNILGNQVISVRFGLISGTSTGILEYEEEYNVITTNQFGLFNLIIGQGANTGNGATSSFANLDWGNARHFLKVEIDAGNGFENLGTTELVSVPYAQYAKSAGNPLKAGDGIELRNDSIINTGDLSNTNESISRFELVNDTLVILNEGNRIDTINLSKLRSADSLRLQFAGNNLYNLSIIGGNQIQFSTVDDDSDALNEIQSLVLNATADTLRLTNGGIGVAVADLSISDNQQLSRNGKTIELTGDAPSSVDLTSILGVDSLLSINDSTIRVYNADGSTKDVVIRGQAVDTSNTNELIDTMYYSNATLKYVQQGVLDSVNLDSVAAGQRLVLRGLYLANRNRINQLQIQFSADSALTIQNRDSMDAVVNQLNNLAAGDQDRDSLNERINSVQLLGDSLEIIENDSTFYVNLSKYSSLNTDEQNLLIRNDSLFIENGDSGIYLGIYSDTAAINALQTELNALSANVSEDSALTIQNRDSIDAVVNQLNNLAAGDQDRDSLNERISRMFIRNDSIIVVEADSTYSVDLSSLNNTGTDNQRLRISNDSILIERGDGIDIAYIMDSIRQNTSRIQLDSARISVNFNAINLLENRLDVDSIRLDNQETNLQILDNEVTGKFTNDSLRIAADSVRLINALITSGNLTARFEADSALQDQDSIRLDNFRTQYTADSTLNKTVRNNNSSRIVADSNMLVNFKNKVQTDSTDFANDIANNDNRIVADSIRLNNAISSSTDLEQRFEADSALQDQDSIRLDNFRTQYTADSTLNKTVRNNNSSRIVADSTVIENFITQYGTDTTGLGNRIDNNATAISTETSNRQTAVGNLSTRIVGDSTNLATHIAADGDLSATNETNTTFQVNGANLEITDASGTLQVPLSNLNTSSDNQNLSISTGKGTISIEDGNAVILNDSSASNETITNLILDNDTLEITEAGITQKQYLGDIGGSAFSTTSNVTRNEPGDYATDDFVFGSSTLDNLGTTDEQSRFFFDKSLSAFRAGIATGFEWNTVNIGQFSAAFGDDNQVIGQHSFAAGADNNVAGKYSTAFGQSGSINGSATHAVTIGLNNSIGNNGIGAIAMGSGQDVNGNYSIGMGHLNDATGFRSLALGSWLTSSGDASFTIGVGIDNTNRIINSIDSSLMIGFNSTLPTFFVGGGSGAGTLGRIGIGTTSPNSLLHLKDAGDIKLEIETGAGNEAAISLKNTSKDWQLINNGLAGGYFQIVDQTSGNSRFVISPDGRVGIGTTVPTKSLFQVMGGVRADSLIIDGQYAFPSVSGAADQVLKFNAGGTALEWGSITGDGNGIFDGSGSLSGNTEVIGGANSLSFTSSLQNAVLFDTNTLVVDALNNRIGIGTATPNSKIDVSDNTSTTSASGYQSASIYSAGTNTSTAFQRALGAQVEGTDGINTAIFGVSNGSSVGTNRGLAGQAQNGTTNTGVRGYAGATPAGANFAIGTYGIAPETSDGINYGIYGSASGSTFINRGVVGVIDGAVTTADASVYGIANGAGHNIALYGRSTFGNTGGVNYGLYTRASGADTNYAAYFETGLVYVGDSLWMPQGAAEGLVLASDQYGKARWENLSTLGYSPWDTTASAIYNTTKSIGIGTSTPTSNLQIVGGNDVNLSANSGMLKLGAESGSHMIFDENEIQAKNDATTAGQLLLQPEGGEVQFRGAAGGGLNIMFSTDNKIGLGTYSPIDVLTVERPLGGGRAAINLNGESDGFMYSGLIMGNINDDRLWEISYRSGAGLDEGLLFQRRDIGGTYVQHMFIDSIGNMALGNLSPTAKLDVTGNIRADSIQLYGGSLGAGKVLMDVNGDGKASWQTPASGTDNQNLGVTSDSITIENGTGAYIGDIRDTLTTHNTRLLNSVSKISTNISNISTNATAISTETSNRQTAVGNLSTRITDDSTDLATHITADGDLSATNELQNLNINGANDSLLLSNGTGVSLSELQATTDTLDIIADADRNTNVSINTGDDIVLSTNGTSRLTVDQDGGALFNVDEIASFRVVNRSPNFIKVDTTYEVAEFRSLTSDLGFGVGGHLSFVAQDFNNGGPEAARLSWSTTEAENEGHLGFWTGTAGIMKRAMTIDYLQNVGIGTYSPTATLEVVGRVKADTIEVDGFYTFPSVSGTANQVLKYNAGGTALEWGTAIGDGNGIYNGSGSLSGATTVTQGANTLAFTSSASNGFSVDGSTFSVNAALDRVGIGTTSPVAKFNVASTEATTGQFDNTATGVANSWALTTSATGISNGTNIALQTNASGATTNFAAIFGNGRVYVQDSLGIGTNAPAYPFHLSSTGNTTARIDAGANNRAAIQFAEVTGGFGSAATGFEASYNGSDDKFEFRSADGGTLDTVLTMDRTTGYVGIQNNNPVATLDVSGAIKLDAATVGNTQGMIQWTGADFEGYDGTSWVSLTSSNSSCPAGMTAVGGRICIENNERTAASWFTAASTCANLGYKLPTWAEWYGAMDNVTVTDETNDWEWVDGGTSNTARKVGSGGLTNTANDDPATGSEAYRCILILK